MIKALFCIQLQSESSEYALYVLQLEFTVVTNSYILAYQCTNILFFMSMEKHPPIKLRELNILEMLYCSYCSNCLDMLQMKIIKMFNVSILFEDVELVFENHFEHTTDYKYVYLVDSIF